MNRNWWLGIVAASTLCAQSAPHEFFEKKIRPVLANKCYGCHSSKAKSPMGNLTLDTKSGTAKAVASGKLIEALRYQNARLQMPPTGKLPDPVIADFEAWIKSGAFDPRQDAATVAATSPLTLGQAKSWWAFQPLKQHPAPTSSRPTKSNPAWAKSKIDAFVLDKLDENQLPPSSPADHRTLVRRVYLDLIGLAPTREEIEAYESNPDYPALVNTLLASPRYGERWGRYWLDVARFAEDNPTSEATNPPYPYAWRYRDWVIEAVNQDIPYNRFVQLQLAADAMPATRNDLRALGYLGAAPIYHKDARLSKEVIETLATDDWDERVDAISRGILGLTVACARCHDHKFDPIPTKDYYALAGVFASTSPVLRPLKETDPAKELRFLTIQQKLIHIDYLAKLLNGEPGTKPEESKIKVARWREQLAKLKTELSELGDPDSNLLLERYGVDKKRDRNAEMLKPEAPFANAVYDAALYVDGSDPDITVMDFRPGQSRDLPIFLRGSVANPGPPAPRAFLSVFEPQPKPFTNGSGRLELAARLFTDAAPLAARVIVNRVWGWHFGKPLVNTPSDFGTQGEKPTHSELLDDLAARFVANGWSLKWLHREILLSATYQQASTPRAAAERSDPTNRWLWRMNPRRMDIEAFRDSMLRATGSLDDRMYGPSTEIDAAGNLRRTVYAKISRSRLHTIFRLYDFSDPSQHSPGRELTTTPLQQLFVMNSPFLADQAAALLKRVNPESDPVGSMYRFALSREPSGKERDLALTFLNQGTLEQYAQALLSTNEFIFWP